MSTLTLPPGHAFWTLELADSLLPDDAFRREVLDGELIVAPNAPAIRHQDLLMHLLRQIDVALPPGWKLFTSPVDVAFPWGDVAQPDLIACSAEQVDLDVGLIAAPSMVVEVLSPSTRGRDLVVKRRLYERHGIETYVIADPNALTLTVLTRDEDGRLIETVEGPTVELTRPLRLTLHAS